MAFYVRDRGEVSISSPPFITRDDDDFFTVEDDTAGTLRKWTKLLLLRSLGITLLKTARKKIRSQTQRAQGGDNAAIKEILVFQNDAINSFIEAKNTRDEIKVNRDGLAKLKEEIRQTATAELERAEDRRQQLLAELHEVDDRIKRMRDIIRTGTVPK
jgi:hypothetical protein